MIRTSESAPSGRDCGQISGNDGVSYDAFKASAFEYQDLKSVLALASE
jgi:hypothetical protein